MTLAADNTTPTPAAPSPRSSGTPLLTETKADDTSSPQPGLLDKGKRMLGLGKKKQGEQTPNASSAGPSPPLSPPLADSRRSPRGSPRMHPAGIAASPNRRIRSTSPGFASPASSQIFERNVQDSVTELDRSELSPHLPTHIQTEDYIPPVLEASSLAITDDHLNPDEVKIVMHSAHQPAAAAVTGSRDSIFSPSQDEIPGAATPSNHHDAAESNYGSIDTADVRRLSFISFADVVQAEQVENDRDAVQIMSLASTANRSPSPMRSPTSSRGFSVSPPTSGATSEKGAEYVSPKVLRSPHSPTHGTHSPPLGGELQIETMRQALRKTGSGDLSGGRAQPLSATSMEESAADRPPFK